MENQELQKLIQVNPLLWANHKKINLRDGIKFSLKGMPYLADLVNCDKRIVNCKKGAQVCMTTTKYLEAIHACYFRKYNQNIMYMMPSVTSVERLSKVSFDPIFQYNRWLQRKGDTNTTMCKEINGRSIVMVGARPQKVGGTDTKDTDNLRSTPCDCVMRDEIDLMDQDMAYMSKQRLKRSLFKHEVNFGTPTFPDYGIDLLYEESDQRKWQIKCRSCGKYTCLVESFPDSIIKKDGKWIRACVHCQSEVFVIDGEWISDYPDRRDAGFWIDGLISPYADLDDYMWDYHHVDGARMSEFMRSTLGIATTEAENQLSEQIVMDTSCQDAIQMSSHVETVMGVDVGKKLHAAVGLRTGQDTYEILNISRLDNFGELHDLAHKMNVKYCVMDAMPDMHAARDFQKKESYIVYLCQYSEQMPGKPKWDKSGMVKVNRNEWCDKVHEIFSLGKIVIPRDCVEVREFAKELTKTAKTVIEHPETGVPKPRWIKLGGGDDHYFHSVLYFMLGCTRTGSQTKAGPSKHKPIKIKNNFIF